MRLTVLILLTIILFSTSTFATPIPGSELYKSPTTTNIKISPDGSLILSSGQTKNSYTLDIIDPKKEERHRLMALKKAQKVQIQSFRWIDDNTIFVKLNKVSGFIHLQKNKGAVTGQWKQIQSSGKIIGVMSGAIPKVVYVKDPKPRKHLLSVYMMTPDQLERGNWSTEDRLKKEKFDAVSYFYDGKFHSLIALTNEKKSHIFWYLSDNSKSWKKILEINKKYDFIPVGFISKDKFAVLTDKNTEHVALSEFDINSQKLGKTLFEHPNFDLVDANIDPITSDIKSVTYVENGLAQNQYFSTKDKSIDAGLKKQFPNQSVQIMDQDKNQKKFLIYVSSSINPGQIYYYDLSTGKAKFIADTREKIIGYTLSKTQIIKVKIKDNQYIESLLTLPATTSNGVLLVYPHGGPIGVQDTAEFDPETQYFASRGYSILKVNFRGSEGFGKDFRNAGKAQWGKIIEQDITSAVSIVRKEHHFDYLCSIGRSYGGYSSIMLAMTHPDDYACVISMYGVYDLPLLFNASNYWTIKANREKIVKTVGELNSSLKKTSPFYFAEKLNKPILLVAGAEDKIAGFEQANRMKYRLKQLNKDVETVFYKNIGHGHHTYRGLRFESAYIDDYIRRKINIKKISDSRAPKAYAEDADTIANTYYWGLYFKKDLDKAMRYYKQAANLGSSDALYKLGKYYLSGINNIKKDFNEGYRFYKKSSAAGNSDASYELGLAYLKGDGINQDIQQAFHYFNLAAQQGNTASKIWIEMEPCLSKRDDNKQTTCTKDLLLKNKRNATRSEINTIRQVTSFILWRPDLDNATRSMLNQRLTEVLHITSPASKLKSADYGVFDCEKNYLTSETNIDEIKAGKDICFGANISFDVEDGRFGGKNKSLFFYRWIRVDEKSSAPLTGFTVASGDKMQLSIHLSETEDKSAQWRLEVRSLDNKDLYSHDFYLTPKEKEPISSKEQQI